MHFLKFQQNSRHYGSMTAGFVLKTHLATAERDIGRRRDGHLWYCTRTWLGSAVFPETCQIETECVKVQSLKALAVTVQLNRHEKVEDKGVKRSAVHISIISQIQCASCFHLISGVHALLRVDAGNGSLYNHLAPWCWLTSWQRWSRWSGWPGSVG